MKAKCAIAVFVKTPGLSPLKTRLLKCIGKESAEKFHELSALATKEVVMTAAAQCSESLDLEFLWAIAENEGCSHALWKNAHRIEQGEGGLGDRLANVYGTLLGKYDAVIFLGADSPQVTVDTVARAAESAIKSSGYVIGPAADGGFYLFGSKEEISPASWKSIPYSTPDTLTELKKVLLPLQCSGTYPILSDVDTGDEFEELKQKLNVLSNQNSKLLPAQLRLLEFMKTVVRT